jgi:hypothetical protein
MKIEAINSLVFQYNHPIKKAFDKGLLPDVKKGLLGNPIDKSTRSLEHLTPKSLGGTLDWDNVAITHKLANSKRGITPIEELVTKQMWIDYLKQFVNVKNKFIDGMEYIRGLCKRFKIDIKEVLK